MDFQPDKQYGAWRGREVERFLEAVRVPLRIGFQSPGGPLIAPLWFRYRDGSFWSCSPLSSALVKSLESHPEVAFDVSTNEIPYRGVRGRALAACHPASGPDVLEDLLRRYLDGTDNPLAEWLLSRVDGEALIRFDIEWLTSWDFSKRMSGLERIADRDATAQL
jgi:hypothetical protein